MKTDGIIINVLDPFTKNEGFNWQPIQYCFAFSNIISNGMVCLAT
jgi:hypothetical protein